MAITEMTKAKLDYLGYNLENLKRANVRGYENIVKIAQYDPSLCETNSIEKEIYNLDDLSLEEIRKLTKIFCEKYFNLSDIFYVDLKTIENNLQNLQNCNTIEERTKKLICYYKKLIH